MNQRTRLFVASCLALVVTAMMFIIRGDITDEVVTAFELDYEQYGFVSAMAFFGFAGSILVVSPLLDWLGMRTGLSSSLRTTKFSICRCSLPDSETDWWKRLSIHSVPRCTPMRRHTR